MWRIRKHSMHLLRLIFLTRDHTFPYSGLINDEHVKSLIALLTCGLQFLQMYGVIHVRINNILSVKCFHGYFLNMWNVECWCYLFGFHVLLTVHLKNTIISNFPLWFHTQSWHSTCNCKVRNPGWLHLAVCVFFVFLFFIFTFFLLSLRACSTMFTGAYAADRVTQTGQIEGEGLGEAIQPLSFLYFLAYSLITSFVFSVFVCPFVVQISIWMTLAIDGP